MGTSATPVSQSYGIVATTDASGTLTNSSTINVYSTGDSYGVLARGTATVENKGNITAYKTLNSESAANAVTAVLADGENTVNNTGTITAIGNNSYAVRGGSSAVTVNNGSAASSGAQIVLGAEGENLSGGAAIDTNVAGTITNYKCY